MELPFTPETELERAVCADPEWLAGAAWGTPRPGHPEGSVAAHVAAVLANVERFASTPKEREKLRFIAIVHDACKNQVDESRPREGPNHHAVLARRLAERFTDDRDLLEIIELHDEGYNAWVAYSHRREKRALERILVLVDRLGPALPLFWKFFQADNALPGKSQDPTAWFARVTACLPPPSTSG